MLLYVLHCSGRRAPKVVRSVVWSRGWRSCTCCIYVEGVLQTSFGASSGAVVGARVRVALIWKACSKCRSERRLEPWLELVCFLHWSGRRAPNVVRSVVWSRGCSSCASCIGPEGAGATWSRDSDNKSETGSHIQVRSQAFHSELAAR